MGLRAKATKYNMINLSSIIIFPSIFVLQFLIWDWWILLLDDDTLALLVGWPIYIMIAIIALNKSTLKNYIHNLNLFHYEANNIAIDNKKDNGSLTDEEKNLLPDFLHEKPKRRDINLDFDLFASGKIDDLQISYKVDKFNMSVFQKDIYRNDKKLIFSYKGDALKVEYENINFGSSPIIFISNSLISATTKAVFKVTETTEVASKGFLLSDNSKTKEKTLDKIKNIMSSEVKSNSNKIYIIFKDNTMIYLTDAQHKYKIKVPFLIDKNKIEELVDGQKAQIYRFNMLLNKISTIFH